MTNTEELRELVEKSYHRGSYDALISLAEAFEFIGDMRSELVVRRFAECVWQTYLDN